MAMTADCGRKPIMALNRGDDPPHGAQADFSRVLTEVKLHGVFTGLIRLAFSGCRSNRCPERTGSTACGPAASPCHRYP